MTATRRIAIAAGLLAIGITHPAEASDISGTIANTLTIFDDSRLIGDVTCTVVGAPCIAFGAPGLTLKLNGFTMTGRASLQTPCATAGNGEVGIDVNMQSDEVILGPGVVQGFRQHGIRLRAATGVTVKRVTANSNCSSGIFVTLASSENNLEENTAVRNGHPTAPCGGI
jgi:parallel beta-helix repeat protein